MRSLAAVTLALAVAVAGASANAQAPAPTRVRATIDTVDGDTIAVTTRNGEHRTFKLAANLRVSSVGRAQISDIQSGSYIGVTAIPQADGTLKALEVHVFPASLRGTGEGHRPWDLAPASTMTNGTVGDVVVSSGRTITVKYGNEEKKIFVPEDAPIVLLEPGDRSLIQPGAKVIVFAPADNPQTAASVSVGKDGVTPPM